MNVIILTPGMDSVDTQFSPPGGTALRAGSVQAALLDRLTRTLGKTPDQATERDVFDALSLAVHEELMVRWLATQRRVANAHVKRVCYLSVEYLPGRSLLNALCSLDGDLVHEARSTLKDMGYDLEDILAQEIDPGLGNGGLGRLAACFLDSLATLQYPAVGYGIRYDYGIFTQVIAADGGSARDRLELAHARERVGDGARQRALHGALRRTQRGAGLGSAADEAHRWLDTQDIYAIGFDRADPREPQSDRQSPAPMVRARHHAVSHRCVQLPATTTGAVREQVDAKNLSRVLYPDDSTRQGKELRLKQQYFFVSASLQDILATHLREGRTLASMPEAMSIQLNDTHPALAIPELMRLLIDEHGLDWDESWTITCRRVRLHQSYVAAGSARDLAGRAHRAAAAAAPRDHLPHQP